MPIKATSARAVKLVPHATLKTYSGGSHGIPSTQVQQFNDDLLGFIQGTGGAA